MELVRRAEHYTERYTLQYKDNLSFYVYIIRVVCALNSMMAHQLELIK
jgi:hypothetical protein